MSLMWRNRKRGSDNLQASENMDTTQWTDHLRSEIEDAHRQWLSANRFFEHAVGKDQIDYAIYSVITAEKRYEMLLRIAKRTCKVWPQWEGGLR